jgi:hypothetical protein
VLVHLHSCGRNSAIAGLFFFCKLFKSAFYFFFILAKSEVEQNLSQSVIKRIGAAPGFPSMAEVHSHRSLEKQNLMLLVYLTRFVRYVCKRLIDLGRVLYLRERGYDARLVRYTSHTVSPENVALIATPLKGVSSTCRGGVDVGVAEGKNACAS